MFSFSLQKSWLCLLILWGVQNFITFLDCLIPLWNRTMSFLVLLPRTKRKSWGTEIWNSLTVKAGSKIRTHTHSLPSGSLCLVILYFYRYVEALRAQIQEKMQLYNITLPPLCCCGPDFWDAHPDTCANNCIFYKNHKGKSLKGMVGAWWQLRKQQQ